MFERFFFLFLVVDNLLVTMGEGAFNLGISLDTLSVHLDTVYFAEN